MNWKNLDVRMLLTLAILAMGFLALLGCDAESPTVPVAGPVAPVEPITPPDPPSEPLACIPVPPGDHPTVVEEDPGGLGTYGQMLIMLREQAKDEFPGLFRDEWWDGWGIHSKRDYVQAIRFLVERDIPGLCTSTNAAGDEIWIKQAGPEGDPNDTRSESEHYDIVAEHPKPQALEAWVWYAARVTPSKF